MAPVLAALLFACSAELAQPPDKVQRWSEDIDSYRAQLQEKHINLYHSVSSEQFSSALEGLKKSLPDLNEQQVLVELMRISRLVGDGHTQIAFWEGDNDYFPFRLQIIEDQFRLVATDASNRHLLGWKLEAIDDIPITELISRLSPVVQGVENEHSLKAKLGWHLGVAQILSGLGVIQQLDSAAYTFRGDGDQLQTVSVRPLSMHDYHKQVVHRMLPSVIPFGEKSVKASDHLWLSADDETRTAYLYFSRYPKNRDMEKFANKVRKYLDANGIRNLIIDLRDNGGGDFFVGLTLAWSLVLVDSLDWDHGIYTLIGNRTYSAGMSNAAQYRQLLNARLVGEPTGGNPVGYQDMDSFTLPNSGWRITYSKRNYRFQDAFSPGIQPDTPVEGDWESYRNGTDKPLVWVMQDIANRSSGRVAHAAPAD
jgi:hypothetical protein